MSRRAVGLLCGPGLVFGAWMVDGGARRGTLLPALPLPLLLPVSSRLPFAVPVAIEALKIADGQGLKGRDDDPVNMQPWRRAFTLGDVRETAEWLAEVYYDVDLVSEIGEPFDGYGRIIIGAPLWIMTPYVKNIRLYEEHTLAALDQGKTSTPEWQSDGYRPENRDPSEPLHKTLNGGVARPSRPRAARKHHTISWDETLRRNLSRVAAN